MITTLLCVIKNGMCRGYTDCYCRDSVNVVIVTVTVLFVEGIMTRIAVLQ